MRPRLAWCIFALFAALLLGVMGWTHATTLRLERVEAEIGLQADLEERVRLALWRMESVLAPLIARESARPYFLYTDYTPIGMDPKPSSETEGAWDSLLPVPQQGDGSPHIKLYFQLAANGTLISPQAPPEPTTSTIPNAATAQGRRIIRERIESLRHAVEFAALDATLSREDTLKVKFGAVVDQWRKLPARRDGEYQAQLNSAELQRRQAMNMQNMLSYNQISNARPPQPVVAAPPAAAIQIGLPKPLWIGDKLLLVRRAMINGQTYLQGCWLDWEVVQRLLLLEVRDLLPQSRLEPAPRPDGSATGKDRILASLPVRLIPGAIARGRGEAWTPMRISLLVAWGCVSLAIAAIGALLAGALALSERRRTFVSSVTHELRTPLTTFRIYTEMLAGGMVQGEEKRARYLNTLQNEADRLTHLVENVLAYARLEAGRRSGRRSERVAVGELVEKIRERLAERARQGGMALEIEMAGAEAEPVRIDIMAAEQIIFNLVDNACKYAAAADDRTIRITIRREGEAVALRVRDHGPGIMKPEARRLFRPFSRSARDAAGNAPGVGLGLALSRRLARAMGGELRLDGACGEGACFVLTLPRP